MPRTSAPDRAAGLAESLRTIALQLQSFADDLLAVDHETAGQALGSDDALTPAQEARLEDALIRHRRRAKQAKPEPKQRRRGGRGPKLPDREFAP